MESGLYSNLLAIAWRYRRRLAVATLMVGISNGLMVFLPLLLRQAVLSTNLKTAMEGEGVPRFLADSLGIYSTSVGVWVLFLMVIAMVSAYFMFRMRLAFVSVSRDVEQELRSQLFARLQAQSRAFFDRHSVGDLMSVLTNDVSAYRDVLGPGVMYPIFFMTLVVPALMALYSISPPMMMLSTLPIIMLPLFVLITSKKVYRRSKEIQDILGEMSTFSQEHFAAARVVKSNAVEEATLRQFNKLGSRYYRDNIWLAAVRGLFFPFLTLLTRVVTISLVLFVGYSMVHSWNILSGADFVSFMWIQSNIFGPVLMLGWVLPIYQRGSAAYARILKLCQKPVEVTEEPKEIAEVVAGADITFRHLTFHYPQASMPVLQDVTLTIQGASFVGITGPVGSGKTTLFRLLNREYEVPRGTLFIGGKDIHDYSLETLRRSIGVVEQAPFLFSKTVAENVGIGQEYPSIEEVEEMSRLADLHDTILTFPMQYDTIVGERGVRLSGGQKQRIAIARTLLVDRSILLLDDIFSAIDAETERRIFEHIRESYAGKTILLITHRTALLQQMDRILYISNGSVVEDGTHEELMTRQGRYAALMELQSLHLMESVP